MSFSSRIKTHGSSPCANLPWASLVFTPAAVSLAPCLDAHTGKTPGTDLFVIAVFITTNQLKTPRARILKAIKDDKK
jgi:hypothetical protein